MSCLRISYVLINTSEDEERKNVVKGQKDKEKNKKKK